MRRSTIATALAAALISGAAVAVPALADSGPTTAPVSSAASSSVGTAGLSADQQQALDQFLSAHPKVATALGQRIDRWKEFADAHPAVVAELAKVAARPADQRRAELKAWAAAHPADAKAWHGFRQQVRDARHDRREARRDARQDRREARKSSTTTTS